MRVQSKWFVGVLSLCASAALTACAPVASDMQQGPTDPSDPGDPVTYELKRPTLTNIAPTSVKLGDVVTVFGKDFIDGDHGAVSMHMVGSFQDQAGHTTRYQGDVPLTFVSSGKATFEFGPSVFFSPSGTDLGTFQGGFQIVNTLTAAAANAEVGDMEVSEVQSLAMTALPSIYVEQIRSVDQNCDLITSGTTAGSNIALGVRAIGMAPGTTGAPIRFTVSFAAPNLDVAFAENKAYSTWPLTTTPSAMLAAQDGTYTISANVTDDNAIVFDPLHYEQVVNVSPPIIVNQQSANTVKLARLAAGKLDDTAPSSTLNFTVQATASDGTAISRVVNFKNLQQLSVQPWNGKETDKQIYDPEMTDIGCVSGGLTGQQYSYSEGSSESRTRSINMNWSDSTSLSATLGADFNVFVARVTTQLNASSTQTFGVDVNTSVSTETHKNFTSTINVLPQYVGVSYRQPVRSERIAPVVINTTCGVSLPVGNAVLTNWRWNFDINQGPSCPPPPSAQMPPARVF